MKYPRLLFIFLLALPALISIPAADARAHDQDPHEIFRKCAAHIEQLADRCQHANAKTAKECLQRIRRLLEEGKREEARHTARHCIHQINRQSDECVNVIRRHCRRCITALLELEANELARRLHQICERAVEAVRHSQRRAIAAIEGAFDRN